MALAILANAVVGGKRPSQIITWYREDGTLEDLTGATLAGKLRFQNQAVSQSIEGALTVIDEVIQGVRPKFLWDYADADVASSGEHRVQFTAMFGSTPTPAKTFVTKWNVEESL